MALSYGLALSPDSMTRPKRASLSASKSRISIMRSSLLGVLQKRALLTSDITIQRSRWLPQEALWTYLSSLVKDPRHQVSLKRASAMPARLLETFFSRRATWLFTQNSFLCRQVILNQLVSTCQILHQRIRF